MAADKKRVMNSMLLNVGLCVMTLQGALPTCPDNLKHCILFIHNNQAAT